jgi:hypothetical protein
LVEFRVIWLPNSCPNLGKSSTPEFRPQGPIQHISHYSTVEHDCYQLIATQLHGLVFDSTKGWLDVCDAEPVIGCCVWRWWTFALITTARNFHLISISSSPLLLYSPVAPNRRLHYQGVLFQSNVAESLGEMKPIGRSVVPSHANQC